MTAKTSYTIPEVAGVCHVSEKLVISWANQGKLKISKVNLEDCVYREDLILFMKRVGFSTETLETSPTKEDILKELLFKNIGVIIDALNDAIPDLRGSGYEKKMEELLVEINKIV
jgi:hypothetical protein